MATKLGNIKDTEGANFGNYKEANGGGTPRGGIWGGKSGRVGWSNRVQTENVPENGREDQPRTDDGKFTYNSVNGKETKYDGRGETVNPLLTGGKNGIKIEDAKKEFEQKSGKIWDLLKDKVFAKGSLRVGKVGKKYKVQVSTNDAWTMSKYSIDAKTGTFAGEEGNWQNKKGRHTKQEKKAKKEAFKKRTEKYVESAKPHGGIMQMGENKLKENVDVNKVRQKAVGSASGLKHDVKEIAKARKDLEKLGVDTSEWSDAQVDSVWDDIYETK